MSRARRESTISIFVDEEFRGDEPRPGKGPLTRAQRKRDALADLPDDPNDLQLRDAKPNATVPARKRAKRSRSTATTHAHEAHIPAPPQRVSMPRRSKRKSSTESRGDDQPRTQSHTHMHTQLEEEAQRVDGGDGGGDGDAEMRPVDGDGDEDSSDRLLRCLETLDVVQQQQPLQVQLQRQPQQQSSSHSVVHLVTQEEEQRGGIQAGVEEAHAAHDAMAASSHALAAPGVAGGAIGASTSPANPPQPPPSPLPERRVGHFDPNSLWYQLERHSLEVPEDIMSLERTLPNAEDLGGREYLEGFLAHLKEIENDHTPNAVRRGHPQNFVTSDMRMCLIDWMIEVCDEYKYMPSTMFLSISLVDRVFDVVSIKKELLQLLGCVCMLIAGKLQEVYPPRAEDFVEISAQTYDRSEVVEYESIVSNALRFELSGVTCHIFLEHFLCVAEAHEKERHFAWYLAELMQLEYQFVGIAPSVQAAAIVYLMQKTMRGPGSQVWTPSLRFYTRYEPRDLKQTVRMLHASHLCAWDNKYVAVRSKYSSSTKLRVSECVTCLRKEDLTFEG